MTAIAAPPVAASPPSLSTPRQRSVSWPLTALIAGMPLWWTLGLGAVAWVVFAVPMAVRLLRRTPIRVPRGFGLWLLFLAWMLLSVTQIEGIRYLSFGYRGLLYVAATVMFLFIYNLSEAELPKARLLKLATLYFIWGTVGGYLGLILGEVGFTSVVEMLLPGSVLENSLAKDLVHPVFAQDQDFLGYVLSRPTAPFVYTNEWGSAMAVLIPIVIAGWGTLDRRWHAWSVLAMIAFLAPAILSVNRGLWVCALAAIVYGSMLMTRRRGGRHLRFLAVGILVVVLAVLVTPLGGVVQGRLDSSHSNNARLGLYEQVIEQMPESPLFGFGAPTTNVDRPLQPAVGTHGHFWTVLYSHGIPAAVFFVLFILSMCRQTIRRTGPTDTWLHVAVALVPMMMWFYEMLAPPLFLVLFAAATALRPEPPKEREPELNAPVRSLRSVLAPA